jgi:glutamate mutase epsilon subunit
MKVCADTIVTNRRLRDKTGGVYLQRDNAILLHMTPFDPLDGIGRPLFISLAIIISETLGTKYT